MKVFLKRITITDYSVAGICLLFLGYYQFTEPRLKFIKADYFPQDFQTYYFPSYNTYAIVQSYKFKFRNKSFKSGYISKIEPFLDSINLSKIEIYSCWIDRKKILPFQTGEIQIDLVITSNNPAILSHKNEGTFRIFFYDNNDNLIEFNSSTSRAEQRLKYNSPLYEQLQKEKTKESLYDPFKGSEYYYEK